MLLLCLRDRSEGGQRSSTPIGLVVGDFTLHVSLRTVKLVCTLPNHCTAFMLRQGTELLRHGLGQNVYYNGIEFPSIAAPPGYGE